MRPYGIDPRRDRGCCPGHDRFPREAYNNRRSIRAHRRDTKIAHRTERRTALRAIADEKT